MMVFELGREYRKIDALLSPSSDGMVYMRQCHQEGERENGKEVGGGGEEIVKTASKIKDGILRKTDNNNATENRNDTQQNEK